MYRSPVRSFNNQPRQQQPLTQPPPQAPQQQPFRPTSPINLRNFSSQPPQYNYQQPSYPQYKGQYPSQESTQLPPPIQRLVYEQPLKVVDIKQYDELWKRRLAELEEKLGKQQPEVHVEERVVFQEDNNRINQLLQEISDLKSKLADVEADFGNSQSNLEYYKRLLEGLQKNLNDANKLIQDRDQAIKDLENENDGLRAQIQSNETKYQLEINGLKSQLAALKNLQSEIDSLKNQNRRLQSDLDQSDRENQRLNKTIREKDQNIKDKEDEIEDLLNQIQDLKNNIQQLEDDLSQTTKQSSYFETEINTWKQKFVESNRNHHIAEEKAMLYEAELENLKKGGMKTTIVSQESTALRKSTTRQSVRVSGQSPAAGRTSDYDQPALNQKDLEAIDRLTKQG